MNLLDYAICYAFIGAMMGAQVFDEVFAEHWSDYDRQHKLRALVLAASFVVLWPGYVLANLIYRFSPAGANLITNWLTRGKISFKPTS